jgi:hypothetical protein
MSLEISSSGPNTKIYFQQTFLDFYPFVDFWISRHDDDNDDKVEWNLLHIHIVQV